MRTYTVPCLGSQGQTRTRVTGVAQGRQRVKVGAEGATMRGTGLGSARLLFILSSWSWSGFMVVNEAPPDLRKEPQASVALI